MMRAESIKQCASMPEGILICPEEGNAWSEALLYRMVARKAGRPPSVLDSTGSALGQKARECQGAPVLEGVLVGPEEGGLLARAPCWQLGKVALAPGV